MRKREQDKGKERLKNFKDAIEGEWQRLTDYEEIKEAIRDFRRKHGLRNGIKTNRGIIYYGDGFKQSILYSEFDEFAKRFNIPPEFKKTFEALVLCGFEDDNLYYWNDRRHTPRFREQYNDGKIIYECILLPDTDIDNPLIMEQIRQWQIEHREKPPRPIKSRTKKRGSDYSPVREYRMRHPDVSLKWIAKELGVTHRSLINAMHKE